MSPGGNPGIVPVTGATEVPTQLHLWQLIQLCGCNHFSLKILNDIMKRQKYENLRISPFDAEKMCARSIKSLNHLIFSEHKRLSLLSPFYFLCSSDMSGQSLYYMHKCCRSYTADSRSLGHLIGRL